MKKIMIYLMVVTLSVTSLCGCGKKKEKKVFTGDKVPQIESIRNLCELATLKCRYNNVAKASKSDGSGPISLFRDNRVFWVKYTGVVEISFDLNKVKMDINNNKVEVTLPKCIVSTSIDPNSWDDESYVSDKDTGLKKNTIKTEDIRKAIDSAQKNMDDEVKNNATLMNSATARAKDIIKSYIDQMNQITGSEYTVEFLEEETEDETETESK